MQLDPTEFEVQCVAYMNLKKEFSVVRGEIVLKVGKRYRRSSGLKAPQDTRGVRADIALFDNDNNLKLIIEVKRHEDKNTGPQEKRYEQAMGVPVVPIKGMEQAEDVCSIVKKYSEDNKIYF